VIDKCAVPYWLREWIEVPVAADGHTGSIFVTPDYLAIGTDSDFLRFPLNPFTAERIAFAIGARLPTRKIVKDIHLNAAGHLAADPMPPGSQMMSTQYFVDHNAKVEAQRIQKGFRVGSLLSGHKKDVVVSPRTTGKTVCIYGWFYTPQISSVIQGPGANCTSHGAKYADYSHGIRFVKDTMLVDGKEMPLDEVMRHPTLHKLVSDEGPFKNTTYIEGGENQPPPPPTGVPSVRHSPSGSLAPQGALAVVVAFFVLGAASYLALA
jgi:hypothetical protein